MRLRTGPVRPEFNLDQNRLGHSQLVPELDHKLYKDTNNLSSCTQGNASQEKKIEWPTLIQTDSHQAT
ncbi:hypothetical protein EUGRSUZ_B03835 [Eucalyptus grandis]|uniref:Uncharacterized protein n=2 Tax=Eucalyptus grandis TaxID=71139 RepID=A0ACC3LXM7_EUCGR|nr:hypothetical protein EUGRSUZ_B03835 [Eucalyptus grandis]